MVVLLMSAVSDWLWLQSYSLSCNRSHFSVSFLHSQYPRVEDSSSRHSEGWAVQVSVHGNLRICGLGNKCIAYKLFRDPHLCRCQPWSVDTEMLNVFVHRLFAPLWKSMRQTSPQPWVQNGWSLQVLPKPLFILAFPTIQNLIFLNITLLVHYHPFLCSFVLQKWWEKCTGGGIECLRVLHELRASVLIITIVYFSAFQQKIKIK